jgi:hypothetical protein
VIGSNATVKWLSLLFSLRRNDGRSQLRLVSSWLVIRPSMGRERYPPSIIVELHIMRTPRILVGLIMHPCY